MKFTLNFVTLLFIGLLATFIDGVNGDYNITVKEYPGCSKPSAGKQITIMKTESINDVIIKIKDKFK